MSRHPIEYYVERMSQPFQDYYRAQEDRFHAVRSRGGPGSHHGVQRERGGTELHTLQVIEMALKLNQSCDEREVIECCLVHDMKDPYSLPLSPAQKLAIDATKGRARFEDWRVSGHHKFVVLVLISDMWSAYLNEDNRDP